jgi:hypothetical protein
MLTKRETTKNLSSFLVITWIVGCFLGVTRHKSSRYVTFEPINFTVEFLYLCCVFARVRVRISVKRLRCSIVLFSLVPSRKYSAGRCNGNALDLYSGGSGSNLGQATDHTHGAFSCFPESLQANAPIRTQPILSKLFSIHHLYSHSTLYTRRVVNYTTSARKC